MTSAELDPVVAAGLALAQEFQLDRLAEKLMTIMIDLAGADRGTLVLIADGQSRVRATAWRGDAVVTVNLLNADVTDDLALGPAIVVPLVSGQMPVGIVRLERDGGIAPARLAMAEMVAAQGAIAIVNAQRFAALASENARLSHSDAALQMARADLARTSHLTVLGGLAASIAHEINQPLSAITAFASASIRWLTRDQPDVAQALIGLESIREGASRADGIIRALRSLARQAPPDMTALWVDDIIRDVLALTSAHHITLTTDLGAAECCISGDRIQLQQVVVNLVNNAIDATAHLPTGHRTVTVTSRPQPAMAVVRIGDNGAGIAPDVHARMFDPLFTTKETGMGMGLAICRSIIEAHGGQLDAVSDARGSTFEFRLPLTV